MGIHKNASLTPKGREPCCGNPPWVIFDRGSEHCRLLGRIVEVVSGVTLDQFVADRIAKPLGLSDTGFYVPSEKLGRIAETQVDSTTGKRCY